MTSEDAAYVLAHENGIDIGRHLDRDTLARVAGHVTQLKNAGGNQTSSPPPSRRPAAVQKQVVVQIAGIAIDGVPGMTAKHAKEARLMAATVYPIMYVFENSARDVISKVLAKGIGADWWKSVVPEKIQKEAARRMRKAGDEAWHSRRGEPIQYVDLPHLAEIVRSDAAWPHFKELLPRQNWFDSIVDDMNVSRRVVAHMNPLASDDIKSVENGFRKWVKQLEAKAELIQ